MIEDERNKTALMVMVMVCVMTGWIPGACLILYAIGISIYLGLAALVLPIVVFIATDKRAHWLLLGSFSLALPASVVGTYVIGNSGMTMVSGLPLFFSAWGVAFVGGLPGVLIGAGAQWLWEELKWRRMK